MNTIIEQIKAEIERRMKRNKEEYAPGGLFEVQDNLAKLLSFLSTLESEKPINQDELDFQTFAKEMDTVFALPKERTINTEENPLNWEYEIARHFAQWGAEHLKK